jgi:hypothetical protein
MPLKKPCILGTLHEHVQRLSHGCLWTWIPYWFVFQNCWYACFGLGPPFTLVRFLMAYWFASCVVVLVAIICAFILAVGINQPFLVLIALVCVVVAELLMMKLTVSSLVLTLLSMRHGALCWPSCSSPFSLTTPLIYLCRLLGLGGYWPCPCSRQSKICGRVSVFVSVGLVTG